MGNDGALEVRGAHEGESALYWRPASLPGVEMLVASYHKQEFAPHWHNTFVVPVVEVGAHSYDYCGRKYVAGRGQIAAINPGESHTAKSACDEGWSYRAFYPSVDFMQSVAQDLQGGRPNDSWLQKDTIVDHEVAGHLLRSHREFQTAEDLLVAETELRFGLSLLLARYAGVKPAASIQRSDARRVALMQERLAADISSPLTLSELGSAVGLSPFHAAHIFSSHLGMAPHAWRNQLRLNRAREMLRCRHTVTETAAACGFADQSHFTRHFKRAYGVSPGRWMTPSLHSQERSSAQ